MNVHMKYSIFFDNRRQKFLVELIEKEVLTKYSIDELSVIKVREIINAGSYTTLGKIIDKLKKLNANNTLNSFNAAEKEETQQSNALNGLDVIDKKALYDVAESIHSKIKARYQLKIQELKDEIEELTKEVEEVSERYDTEIEAKDAEIEKLKNVAKEQAERIGELKEINQLLKREIENKS